MSLELRIQNLSAITSYWLLAVSFWLLTASLTATAQTTHTAQVSSCQAQDLEIITSQLLKDLPSYANRITQSARRRNRTVDVYSYVLLAGRPEFAPLTLGPGEYTPTEPTSSEPRQVFITTLERQYIDGKPIQLQDYHWLFLTQTSGGWKLAMMFSRTGGYPAKKNPTPPRESSDGVIAQAIRVWLRDCQARGVIKQ